MGKTIPTESFPPNICAIIGTNINPAPEMPVFDIPTNDPQSRNSSQRYGVFRKS